MKTTKEDVIKVRFVTILRSEKHFKTFTQIQQRVTLAPTMPEPPSARDDSATTLTRTSKAPLLRAQSVQVSIEDATSARQQSLPRAELFTLHGHRVGVTTRRAHAITHAPIVYLRASLEVNIPSNYPLHASPHLRRHDSEAKERRDKLKGRHFVLVFVLRVFFRSRLLW